MADETERIVVEVDGSRAEQAFRALAAAGGEADRTIDRMSDNLNRLQYRLNVFGGAAQTAAQGNTNVAQTANAAAQGVQNAGNAAQQASAHFNALQQSLFGVRGKAAFIWDLAIDGFKASIGFAETFIEKISGVQRTLSLLATIPGSDSAQEFTYLRQTADKYGLSLRAVQDDYAKLNLAAQNTKLTQEDVRRLFEQTSLATRTLHLNTQQTQLTFLALEQMLSKGKLSMEELRKQFAERIPGAMQAFASELGVPYAVLEKFITKVGAASDKIVPELGNAIQRLYQSAIPTASQALDAQVNRMETSVTAFYTAVLQKGGAEGMTILLKQLNELLQSDQIATVFSKAMNNITQSITDFLRELKPADIERFADVALDFLKSFATLAVAAGNAVVFLSKHLPETAAAFGAFMGATALAPMGPWGAALGAFIGGTSGYLGGKMMSGSAMSTPNMQAKFAEMQALDAEIAKKQGQLESIDEPTGRASSMGEFLNNLTTGAGKAIGLGSLAKGTLGIELQTLKKNRQKLFDELEPLMAAAVRDQSPNYLDLPELGDKPALETDPKKAMKKLMDRYRLSGDPSKEEIKAAQEEERRRRFIQDLQARVERYRNPEEDRFEDVMVNAQQLGIKSGHPLFVDLNNLVVELQSYYNQRKDAQSKQKALATEKQFDAYTEASQTESAKFGEKYDLGNLKQVDEKDYVARARQMGNLIDREILEQQKKWDERIRQNPLFALNFDKDAEIKKLREMGDAYINEFKRIEAEKRTVLGGTKAFLLEWNENATNFGQITSNFLKGVTDGISGMLFDLVKTGELSFKKLTQFVLDYMIKMLIVQAMTPFVNSFSSTFANILGTVLGAPTASTGSSAYSFNSGGGLGLKYRASGGQVNAGESYWVGERGFERFTPSVDGYITPNHALTGGSPTVISVQVNVASDGSSSSKVNATGGNALGQKLADAMRSIIVDEKRPGGLLANG